MQKVDTKNLMGRTSVSTLSAQWASRPDDQRFLSLVDLGKAVEARTEGVGETTATTADFRAVVDREVQHAAGGDLQAGLYFESGRGRVAATNWAFSQMCARLRAPASYLASLPAELTRDNLNNALSGVDPVPVKAYTDRTAEGTTLRAITSPSYGRIYDRDVVRNVKRLVDDSPIEWKVPGAIDWGTGMYNADLEVTKQSTTLYASDRDIFMFLCADKDPIEIGKLPNGDSDLVYRGFYVSNSEVGSRSFSIATMYYRAICCNRILWGVENFKELKFRHSSGAPDRFLSEVTPALRSYGTGSASSVVEGVNRARAAVVAKTDEQRHEFLQRQGFSKKESVKIADLVLEEEGRPAENIWDFAQGITAAARSKPNTDVRLKMERVAGSLLAKV